MKEETQITALIAGIKAVAEKLDDGYTMVGWQSFGTDQLTELEELIEELKKVIKKLK